MTALTEISKKRLTPEQKAEQKKQRTQAQVGLASNVLGLTAGTAATGAALRDPRFKGGGKIARGLHWTGKKIPAPIASRTENLKGKKAAMLAGGALALQAGNMAGDVVANRVLARNASGPEGVKKAFNPKKAGMSGSLPSLSQEKARALLKKKPKGYPMLLSTSELPAETKAALMRERFGPGGPKITKAYNAESWTEVYVAKADHTVGHGSISKLSDSEFRSQVKERTKEHRRANIIGGTTSGALLGGLTGAMIPGTSIKTSHTLRRAGIGGAVGGAAMAGALNAAHSRALNRATKDPVARYKLERGMERQDRLKARALQAAADRNAVQKAYRRYDPEADRQRRLGLAAGAGIGTAAILGSQAAKRYTLSLPEKGGKKLRGIAVRPGRGKAAAALTAGALASGAAGAAAYKRGLSERNNPWN